jgi:hypothetical protein
VFFGLIPKRALEKIVEIGSNEASPAGVRKAAKETASALERARKRYVNAFKLFREWESKQLEEGKLDKYTHCMAACELIRKVGLSPEEARLLGLLNEIYNLNSAIGQWILEEISAGRIEAAMNLAEFLEDSIGDLKANEDGINCPPELTCECCCKKHDSTQTCPAP